MVLFFLSQTGGSSESYSDEIEKYWSDRHDFFRSSSSSPFIQKEIEYTEVSYFNPDASYKVNGKLDRFTKRETLVLGNSDGTTTTYIKYANVHFKLKNKSLSLLVLKPAGFGRQFLLAFGDETSGDTSYGGGRYLDIAIGKSDEVILDFNKAYNPYCAYFDDFTCPLPPIENLLEIAILAGEKDYKK